MKQDLNTFFLTALLSLAVGSAWAIEPVDGVYQIGTAQDWTDFCTLHNEGTNQNLNAELTADITVVGNTMIGINGGGKPYRGVFDGKGHTLTISYNLNEERVAPFRRINGATIKNLIVEGTITTTSKLASGLVGGLWQNGTTIQNCISYVVITDDQGGDATHGGICGSFEDVNGANTIENCAFLGEINAPNREGCGGIVGWTNNNNNNNIIRNCLVKAAGFKVKTDSNNDIICRNNGNVVNCYYIGSIDGMKNDKGAIAATTEQAASGELCYILNGQTSTNVGWFQTIGVDNIPLPIGTAVVYANGELRCDGITLKPGSELTFSNVDGRTIDPHDYVDGICSFCHDLQLVAGVYQIGCADALIRFAEIVNSGNGTANAVLTKNIDMTGKSWTPIGNTTNKYVGTFDGQGHVIDHLVVDLSQENVGIFGVVGTPCTIKNLIAGPNNSIKGTKGVGGIVGYGNGNQDWLKFENVGNEGSVTATSQDAGGIIGYIQHQTIRLSVENCYNAGAISAGSDSNNHEAAAITGWTGELEIVITGFYNIGTVSGSQYGIMLWRGINNNTCKRVYSKGNSDNGANNFTDSQLTSGELAYLLNGDNLAGVWHQTIGTDRHPYPFSGDHMVVSKDNDDYYNGSNLISIASGSELNTFATSYNNGMYAGACKVKLTSDLDMYGISYPGIGVDSHYFVGVLDGQGYIISNLSMKDKDINHDNIGFINAANAPSSIRNLTLDNSCSINVSGKKYVGGIMGACFGNGIVSFYNCGNEAAITANKNPGGVLGCNLSGDVTIQMKNCYNTGAITGANGNDSEGGGISGWLGNNSVITNCYSTGSVSYGEAFARGNSATVTNCYALVTSGGGNCVNADTRDTDEFADGTVLGFLAGGTDGSKWHIGFSGGTAHPVVNRYVELSENYNNSVQDGSDVDVSLYRTIKQGGWNTFCVPFDMTSAQITAYFGADTEVAVLDESKNGSDDVLHFKVVNEIEAGQAYLVYPGVAAGFSSKAIEGVTISATSPQDGITQAGFTFKGVYEPTELVATEDRIVVSGNKIVKTTGGKLNGFRAYFKPTGANARATRFVIDDDDEVTGIITAEGEVIMDQPVYNLRGQRVQEGNSSSRGLLIKGGKKYVKM